MVKYRTEYQDVVERFIADMFEQSGCDGVVIGYSGGLDSSVVAQLCKRVLGAEKVHLLFMPDKDQEGGLDAFPKEAGLECEEIAINPMIAGFGDIPGSLSKEELGNLKARLRMCILYAAANANNWLVVGTSNKSELAVGYFTKFGDGGSDILPIGDLYKTQVLEMAKDLDIPEYIINRPPSADLYPGQEDEKELGMSYHELDQVLQGIEFGLDDEEVVKNSDSSLETVARVRRLVRGSTHKRRRPPIPKLGVRTFGLDWREY